MWHVSPANTRGWWICLPSKAICIAHYTARLHPCAWMWMGNWTRPGASSMQLLSLGRRSSTESGLKSAWHTWCSPLSQRKLGNMKAWSYWPPWMWEGGPATKLVLRVRLWSIACMPLCEVWGSAGLDCGSLCEQKAFGVDRELCQGLAEVDYRARYPPVLTERMSRIKRVYAVN